MSQMLALAFFMVAHLLCFHPMVEFRTLINNHYTSGDCIYFIFSFWHPSDLFVIYYCYTYTENFLNYFLVSNVIYLEVAIFILDKNSLFIPSFVLICLY